MHRNQFSLVSFCSQLQATSGLTVRSLSRRQKKYWAKTAKLTEQHLEEKEGLVTYKSTHQATTIDAATGKLGTCSRNIRTRKNHKKCFAEIVASNSAMVGQKNSADIGEESWIHTDESNFYLIMFRKENKILRAKINKLTTRADLNELINILKKMDESLDSKLSKLRILTTLVSIL